MIVGYTTGVFDLFHVGHLRRLVLAKKHCDYLIVGVSTDDCTLRYKRKRPIIPFEQRLEIVQSLKHVDEAVRQATLDKYEAWERYHFNVLIVGDDESQRNACQPFIEALTRVGVRIVFEPRCEGISTSDLIIQILHLPRGGN
jgi:glycerol-3-phosphate cytidylyltransferase